MPRLCPSPQPRPPGEIALSSRVAVRCLGPRLPGRAEPRQASGPGRTRDGRTTVGAARAIAASSIGVSSASRARSTHSCLALGLGREGAGCRQSTRCGVATPAEGLPRGSVLGGWGGAARGGRRWWPSPSRGAWPPPGPGPPRRPAAAAGRGRSLPGPWRPRRRVGHGSPVAARGGPKPPRDNEGPGVGIPHRPCKTNGFRSRTLLTESVDTKRHVGVARPGDQSTGVTAV
jgi:hypothetical protein